MSRKKSAEDEFNMHNVSNKYETQYLNIRMNERRAYYNSMITIIIAFGTGISLITFYFGINYFLQYFYRNISFLYFYVSFLSIMVTLGFVKMMHIRSLRSQKELLQRMEDISKKNEKK